MNPVSIIALSMSMSVDAFAVAVGRGAALDNPRLTEAMRTGLVFGIVEAITPFVGWLFGIAANDWVAHFDHWLAFLLLAAVGLHMIYGAFKPGLAAESATKTSFAMLMATALGTSIDAMAVGLSLALIDVGLAGILAVSLGVGVTTLIFATGGMMIGKAIGERFGTLAEVVAGIVLFAIGGTILFDHLTA